MMKQNIELVNSSQRNFKSLDFKINIFTKEKKIMSIEIILIFNCT